MNNSNQSYSYAKPFFCSIQKINFIKRYFQEEYLLLYIIEGNCSMIIEDTKYNLVTDDLILVNSNEQYELYSDTEVLVVSLKFSLKHLNLGYDLYFKCFSNGNSENDNFSTIKLDLAQLLKSEFNSDSPFNSLSFLYHLIEHLRLHFISERKLTNQTKHLKRIKDIQTYIEENYNKRITLKDLAEHEHLSVSYLSNFIEKCLGRSFLAYYNNIRLNYAVNDLITTNLTIEEIALRNGFDDPRSLVAAFKKRYNILPSKYRILFKKHNFTNTNYQNTNEDDVKKVFTKMHKYLWIYARQRTSYNSTTIMHLSDIDITKDGQPLNNALHMFIGISDTYDLLLADVQNMLKRAQKEIGFKYLKLPNIFTDNLRVYSEDDKGITHYNYALIDIIFDFILSLGIKPLIEIEFRSKDLNKWQNLIENLLTHLISKYGFDELDSWLFTLGNQPTTITNLFGTNNLEAFFEFLKISYDAIKNIYPKAKIGMPLLPINENNDYTFLTKFYNYFTARNFKFAFSNFWLVSNNFTPINKKNFVSEMNKIQKDPNFMAKSIDYLTSYLQRLNITDMPFYITNWEFTTFERDLINDTCFRSCHLVKNYLENYNKFDGIGGWSLTDLNSESAMKDSLYFGGKGLFTRAGIEKSSYNALVLLTKLGKEIIYQGDGYLITKSYRKISIMLYNYVHYSDLYADGRLALDTHHRYVQFNMKEKKKFKFDLVSIPTNEVLIKQYLVNREVGSSYDYFLKMGGIELKNKEETSFLKNHASYSLNLAKKEVLNGKLEIEAELLPLEIRLIEICI